MASSGRITLYDFAAQIEGELKEMGYLDWIVLSQSPQGNTSTIKWAISANYSYESYFIVQNYSLRVDSQSIKTGTIRLQILNGMTAVVAEGSFVVSHNDTGNKTINIVAEYAGYTGSGKYVSALGAENIELPTIDRAAKILTASHFTDEENPVITYSNPANGTLTACISLDGTAASIPYRTIDKTGSSYTFSLTDTERNTLRSASKDKQSMSVTYILKCVVDGKEYLTKAVRTFTVVNSAPVLNDLTVKDVNSDTIALTGNANTLIRYESMAEYSFTATAKKSATITRYMVQCGNKKITGMTQGVIDDVESGTFTFSATDSRGITTNANVKKNFINYIKPTCHQNVKSELEGETGAKVVLTISGNYFNGSFGATNNTLKIEVRHTQNDGTMGEWVDLSPLGYTYEGNTYELETTITGLSYSQAYTFQSRVTDKLNLVQSAQYTVQVLPVFDWSNDDFNFNVPVNINGDLVVNGNITATGGTGTGDFIVGTGTEAMGSNGTWYWEKWASGKAVCWGKRNFGKMSTSNAINNIYRSAMYSQSFPTGLFTSAPDVINASINTGTANWGGWVLLSNPTASSTGDFSVAHSHNLTLAASNIGFYVVGRWK